MLVCAEDNSGFILTSPMVEYCGTEWVICINVATGWFLTRKGILRILGNPAVATG
jgi:hypothetical protein